MVTSASLRVLIAVCACGLVGDGDTTEAATKSVPPLHARHSPYVDGNASPALPAGQPDRVAVVARGKYRAGEIPIVVRNNTPTTVRDIRVGALATSPAGKVIATGTSTGLHPFLVGSGEISIGYIYFQGRADSGFPPGTRFKLTTIRTSSRSAFRDLVVLNSTIDQTVITGEGVTGVARNPRSVPLGTDSGIVACFTDAGKLLYTYAQGQNQTRVRAHGLLRFVIGVYDVCPVYLVAVSGRV